MIHEPQDPAAASAGLNPVCTYTFTLAYILLKDIIAACMPAYIQSNGICLSGRPAIC